MQRPPSIVGAAPTGVMTMSATEEQGRTTETQVEFECSHGDCLTIKASIVTGDPETPEIAFLRLSAAYMLGVERGNPEALPDPCTSSLLAHRSMLGNEIAALIRNQLDDQLSRARHPLTLR